MIVRANVVLQVRPKSHGFHMMAGRGQDIVDVRRQCQTKGSIHGSEPRRDSNSIICNTPPARPRNIDGD